MSNELAKRIEAFVSRVTPLRSSQGGPGLAVGSILGPREDNQDRAAAAYVVYPSGEALIVGIVCDGMGGMERGGEAAGCAVSTFLSNLIYAKGRDLRSVLVDCLAAANREVFRRFRGNGGTTLTALAIASTGETWVAHVGDSRLYEIAANKVPQLVTRDDTIVGQLRTPDSTGEDALDNRLLQFVGIGGGIEPHIFPAQNPHGQGFLLTTDGAHGIGKKSLEGIVRNSNNPSELVRKILFVADAVGIQDNCSAVVINSYEFDRPSCYSNGIEVTIWSASEKLEMWLGSGPISDFKAQREKEFTSDHVKHEDVRSAPPKQKKKLTKSKAKRDVGKASESEIHSEKDKPQLKIEFGNGNEGAE